MRKKMINLSAALLGTAVVASTLFSCSSRQQESPMKAKVEEYASVELKSDLVNNLSDKEKEQVISNFSRWEKLLMTCSGNRHLVIRVNWIPLPTAMRSSLP